MRNAAPLQVESNAVRAEKIRKAAVHDECQQSLGSRGQLPARGYHRSGGAQFGHPAPRAMESLRHGKHFRHVPLVQKVTQIDGPNRRHNVFSSNLGSIRASLASFSCRVEMISRPDVLIIYPSRSPITRPTAFPPPGPLGRVPRLHRHYQ
jgi:hypothetical protein